MPASADGSWGAMIVTKQVEIPARMEIREDYRICDLCKQRIAVVGAYEVEEVEISYRTGTCYPGDYEAIEYSVDMCPACFLCKLAPWLAGQGAALREEERG